MNKTERDRFQKAVRKFIGMRVQMARTLSGMPANTCAEKCGVSRSTLYRIEQGKADAPVSVLSLIAWATGTTLQQLVGYPEHAARPESEYL